MCRNGEEEEEEGDGDDLLLLKRGGGVDVLAVLLFAPGDEDLNDGEEFREEDEAVSERSEPVESLFEDRSEAAKAGFGFLKKKEDEDSIRVGRSLEGV